MNKTWVAIIGAGLCMIAIMVYLTIKGVSHRAHTFIKWSSVEEFPKAGLSSMRRMFPLLKELQEIQIIGDPKISEDFIRGFDVGLQEQNIVLPVLAVTATTPAEHNLIIELRPLETTTSPGSCSDVPKETCLLYSAHRLWLKKERDRTKYWFFLQWVSKNRFFLFYTPPK